MARSERFEAKDSLKFYQVLPPGLGATAIICPRLDTDSEVVGHKMKKSSKWQLVDAEDDTLKTDIAERNRRPA